MVAINYSSQPFQGSVDLANSGNYREVHFDSKASRSAPPTLDAAPSSLPVLFLDAWGWKIFQRKAQ
jgi:hypothetical protein